jgi:hypothetical protein
MARGSRKICLPEAKRHETKSDCIPVEKGVGSGSRRTRSLGDSVSRGLRRTPIYLINIQVPQIIDMHKFRTSRMKNKVKRWYERKRQDKGVVEDDDDDERR